MKTRRKTKPQARRQRFEVQLRGDLSVELWGVLARNEKEAEQVARNIVLSRLDIGGPTAAVCEVSGIEIDMVSQDRRSGLRGR